MDEILLTVHSVDGLERRRPGMCNDLGTQCDRNMPDSGVEAW